MLGEMNMKKLYYIASEYVNAVIDGDYNDLSKDEKAKLHDFLWSQDLVHADCELKRLYNGKPVLKRTICPVTMQETNCTGVNFIL